MRESGFFKLSQLSGSNRRPDDYKSTALPTELSWLKKFYPQNSLAGLLQGFSICPLFAGRAVFGGGAALRRRIGRQNCGALAAGNAGDESRWRRALRLRIEAAFGGGIQRRRSGD